MTDPTQNRWQRIEDLFHRALDLPPADRLSQLAEWCAGDADLYREVESLLDAEARQSSAEPLPTPAPVEDADPFIGRTLGSYQLDRCLGRGGMGAVYLAHRVVGGFQQQVAIKVVGARFTTPWLRDRFVLERQVLARLQHRNVAHLLDGGLSESGEPYLVMEFIDGLRLDHYCEVHRCNAREIVNLVLQVCEAVSFAHRNLVVHRDLKPANILVTQDGVVKLLDFGTAKLLDPAAAPVSEPTRLALRAFTPEYASPEQMFGETVAAPSDIYSLGVILYRLLTGHLPYNVAGMSSLDLLRTVYDTAVTSPSDVITRIVRDTADAPPPVTRAEEIRGDLDAIVLKALRPAPEHRYGSVDDFARDLENYLAHRPVLARAGGHGYRLKMFLRRHATAVTAAAIMLTALAAGLISATRQAVIAQREAQRAHAGFEDVRRLANLLLLDFNDQVKQLPGSTPVQQKLVGMGLGYLDQLAAEAGTQPEVQLDLVRAYTRLANLQGNPYDQNLGDAKAAVETVGRAEPIAARLEQQRSDPEAVRAIASLRSAKGEILFSLGDPAKALESAQHAATTLQKLADTGVATADDYAEISAIWGAIGDMYGLRGVASFGDTGKAEAAYLKSLSFEQQALRINPQHLRALRGLAINSMKVANSRQERDPDAAVTDYQAALDNLAKLPSQARQQMGVQRLEAMILVKLGETLPEVSRAKEALAPLDKGCAIYRGFVTLDPDDTRARYDLATCTYHSAVAQYRLGAMQKSRDHYLEVVRLMDQLMAKFPTNNIWKGQIATSAEAAGYLCRDLGQKEEGDRLIRRGLTLAVEVAEHLDSSANDLSRAGRILTSVEPPAWRDLKKGLAFCRRAVEKSNGARPMLNLELARALRANGLDAEARVVIEKTLATLSPGKSLTRTMLEDELKAVSQLAQR